MSKRVRDYLAEKIDPGKRCRAHSARTKKPCQKWAIRGGTVCATHGGSAPQVKRMAAERIRDMLAEAVDPDRAMRETAILAYSDIRDLFDEHGNLLPAAKWPDAFAPAVAGVEVVERNLHSADGKVDIIVKVRLWPKDRAIEMLMKHHGKLKETLEHKGEVRFTWEK